MSAYAARGGSAAYYRPATYAVPKANVSDDYERWYTERVPTNRMSLSLQSGIESEISWALDRLCRVSGNDQFLVKPILGLGDALYVWPEWYVDEGHAIYHRARAHFSVPRELERKRRNALESLFVLRCLAGNEQNTPYLASHSRTMPFLLKSLNTINPEYDENTEFTLLTIEYFQLVASHMVLPPPSAPPSVSPLRSLQSIVMNSSNRPTIIAAFNALTALISNPQNVVHVTFESPCLDKCLQYLPLFQDPPLLEACLDFLYTQVASPPIARAFLLRDDMPTVLRLLIMCILKQQVEETVNVDVLGTVPSVPWDAVPMRPHDLTPDELRVILPMPEPERCLKWMKTMFIANPEGELSQVELWNLYKDTFSPHHEQYSLLPASDVIRNVHVCFPQAQAMVLQPTQKFVVRGVERIREVLHDRFKCLWDRSQCLEPPCASASDLYEHLLGHVQSSDGSELPCSWSTCSQASIPKNRLRVHVLTHLPPTTAPEIPDSQSTSITLSTQNPEHPLRDPTQRLPPPPPSATISYQSPRGEPPPSALTALLCIRVLFKTAFAESEEAPKLDEDHFGFPGVLEEDDPDVIEMSNDTSVDSEREGQGRGRQAFVRLRHLMEDIRIQDEALMSWISEMVVTCSVS